MRYRQLLLNRRLVIFLAVAFGITWSAWGVLGWMARAQMVVYGQWPFMVLYVLGGLGPTIAAYIAVLSTSTQAPLREFHQRLFRWRVAGRWYVIAMALPISLAIISTMIVIHLNPDLAGALSVRPWIMFLPLFAMMIVGGGLEELGWRGVAQPELTTAFGPAKAALSVGLIWAIWHAPLFFLPGVSQYGGNFPVFAIGVIANALMLGWLYSRTDSILLCIVFHASANAITSLGFAIPHGSGWLVLLGPCLNVLVGAFLLVALPVRPVNGVAANYQ
jgi:membrane protease YdiL (CAAX protease family)